MNTFKGVLIAGSVAAGVAILIFLTGGEFVRRQVAIEAGKAGYRELSKRETSDKKVDSKSSVDICVAAGGLREDCIAGVRGVAKD